MIDILNIKQAIIDQATSGKLSKHFESDVDIKLLISVLPAPTSRREKLLKQKSEIEDELFEIPSYWAWVKLGEISSYGDTAIKTLAKDLDADAWVLELEDIDVGGKIIRKTRVETRKPIGEKTVFRNGQLLYSKLRPYLKKVLVADEDGVSTPELICLDVFCGINTKYIKLCLTNSWVDKVVNKRAYGIKMPRVDAGFMVNLPIPLPPIEEQNRIVDKVEEILEVLDHIDSLQSQYATNVEVLKCKLIDAGIRGKLTEQLPEDGNAEDLYNQIQDEKARLIKESKIKKEKPLPDISEDEIPFEIPKSWKWVRIGKVINEVIVPQRDKPSFSGNIPWCRIEDRDGIYLNGTKSGQYVSEETIREMNLRIFPVGTVLSACSGASIGTFLVNTVECCTNQTFNGLVCNDLFYNWYLFWFLKSEINRLKSMGSGSAMAYISQDKIRNMLIPLPPIAEQKRIVEKLEAMMELL